MSDETYYTVLDVKETASAPEIKTAYRDLIKQVHPDTIANLAPYLRKIAEDKTKEIIEAYTVLSNSSKRRDYDRQLAEYRRQTVPKAPPAPQEPPSPAPQQTSQCPICGRSDGGHSVACVNYRTSQAASTSSGPYCNRCGTSLYASGFCPKCNKFTAPSATPSRPATPHAQAKAFWLTKLSHEHPYILVFAALSLLFFFTWLGSDTNTSQSTDSNPDVKAVAVEAHNQTDVEKKEEFRAEQVAVLRNGFSIKHERREIVGSITRLYANADGSSFIDVPTAEIDHFEAAPAAPQNKVQKPSAK